MQQLNRVVNSSSGCLLKKKIKKKINWQDLIFQLCQDVIKILTIIT